MRLLADEPHRWTLAFRDRAREAAFMEAYGREVRGFYRVATVAILILWSASVGLDLAAPAGERAPSMIVRFAAVTPVVLVAIAVAFAPRAVYLRWWQPVAVATFATVQAGTVALAVVSAREVIHYQVGGFILVMLIGAGLDLARAIYIVAIGSVLAVAMAVALASSPYVAAHDLTVDILWVAVALAGAIIVSGRAEIARRLRFIQRGQLERERTRTETLLRNLLPEPIAARLREGPTVIADALDEVTVLFADLKGFSELATEIPPEALVDRLDRVFSAFDDLAREHGLEKIKTMGDAYMAVAGAPFRRADHASAAAAMARAMIERLAALEPSLALRVGLASGPVVAGVIGRTKHSYDLWGETVNLASRMESHGVPGRIQIAERTRALLGPEVAVEDRGAIELKGLGPTRAFLLAPAPGARSAA